MVGQKRERAKNHPHPNLIFIDINMPLMGGFEFIKHYATLSKAKKKDTLIIFLSTSNSKKDNVELESTDLVYDFIQKPLRKNVLLKILEEYKKLDAVSS